MVGQAISCSIYNENRNPLFQKKPIIQEKEYTTARQFNLYKIHEEQK